MARVKYSSPGSVISNLHQGFVFQRNHYGNTIRSKPKNDRSRLVNQLNRMNTNQKAVSGWRNLNVAAQAAWSLFATTYPQPTKKDPNNFLTGYQLYLKIQSYIFLQQGISAPFLTAPAMELLSVPDFSVSIVQSDNCVDLTEQYLQAFGVLPVAGQFVICQVLPIAQNSGQFFPPYIATIEILATYIDGLFASFHFVANTNKVSFLLYLSKPVHQSMKYAGTKFRYMGCFKPTKFLELSDTPASYAGAAGLFLAVNAAENSLIFL